MNLKWRKNPIELEFGMWNMKFTVVSIVCNLFRNMFERINSAKHISASFSLNHFDGLEHVSGSTCSMPWKRRKIV